MSGPERIAKVAGVLSKAELFAFMSQDANRMRKELPITEKVVVWSCPDCDYWIYDRSEIEATHIRTGCYLQTKGGKNVYEIFDPKQAADQ